MMQTKKISINKARDKNMTKMFDKQNISKNKLSNMGPLVWFNSHSSFGNEFSAIVPPCFRLTIPVCRL